MGEYTNTHRAGIKSDLKKKGDLLADEQQINLCWVNQIYVRECIHSLQPRVDTTVQLAKNIFYYVFPKKQHNTNTRQK